MLWVVLLLVLVSFGLLVAALATTNTAWAWGSVGASGVAGGLLVADWLGRRGTEAEAGERAEPEDEYAEDDGEAADYEAAEDNYEASEPAAHGDVEPAVGGDSSMDEPAATRAAAPAAEMPRRTVSPVPPGLDPAVEPDEEKTDIGDAMAVAILTDEVRVIDERPRYHLAGCRWVGSRDTLPLPVREARELGFTPCGSCRPDAELAARHRTARA